MKFLLVKNFFTVVIFILSAPKRQGIICMRM